MYNFEPRVHFWHKLHSNLCTKSCLFFLFLFKMFCYRKRTVPKVPILPWRSCPWCLDVDSRLQLYAATAASFTWKKADPASADRRAEPLIRKSRAVYQTPRCQPAAPAENHETEPPRSLFLSAFRGACSFCPDARTDVKDDNWRPFSCTGHEKGHSSV